MLKPTASYRMSKQAKRTLARYVDPHKRGEIKRSSIQAELSANIQPRIFKDKKTKENT